MSDLKNFEIIKPYQPYKGKFNIYFIESHLSHESKSLEIKLDPNDSSIENLNKVDESELKCENVIYIISIYKFSFIPSLIDRKIINYDKNKKLIEIKIILTHNKCIFESINTINIEKDNFLGMIKFSEYKWYLGMKYQPPLQALLSDLQIMNYFINTLIIKENKSKGDLCYTALINYGIDLLKSYNNYDYEFFLLLYFNTFYNESGNLIQEALDIFDIEKVRINNNLSILNYSEELGYIYKNQYYHLEKLNDKSEKYLFRFYAIYIHFLNTIKQDEKLLLILYELMDNNKYEQLILPKLYLSNFFDFYKTLIIPNNIKIKLADSVFKVSNSYFDLMNSISLISQFTNNNFVKLISIIKNYYDKINSICYNEKKCIILEYNFEKNIDENELSIIKECFDFFLTMKKKYNFEAIRIDIKTYIYFITNNYNKDFLYFLENKLFDSIIIFEDIKDALLFSSQLRFKKLIPLLEIIIFRIDTIINICKKCNRYIDIEKYIKTDITDDLTKIKELILSIVQKEKKELYKFIKFNINIWLPYTVTKKLEDLFAIRKIISINKEIENEIDEDIIGLGEKIHNLGMELIRNNELKGDKLTEFLGEDQAFYTDKKIKNLEKENDNLKMQINNINVQINNIKKDFSDLKSDVKSLFITKEILINKIETIEDNIKDLRKDIYFLQNSLNK